MSCNSASCFITVKYGNNREQLFNLWCHCNVLIECIRRKCQCEDAGTIDLVDLEGRVKNLSNRPEEYAHQYIDGRTTYILVRVEKQSRHEPRRYVCLLDNVEELHPQVLERLNSSTSESRSQTSSGRRDRWAMMRTVTKMGMRPVKSRESKRAKEKA